MRVISASTLMSHTSITSTDEPAAVVGARKAPKKHSNQDKSTPLIDAIAIARPRTHKTQSITWSSCWIVCIQVIRGRLEATTVVVAAKNAPCHVNDVLPADLAPSPLPLAADAADTPLLTCIVRRFPKTTQAVVPRRFFRVPSPQDPTAGFATSGTTRQQPLSRRHASSKDKTYVCVCMCSLGDAPLAIEIQVS